MGQWIAGVLALVIPVLDTASLAAAVLTAAALLFTLLLVARASTPPTAPLRAIATSVRHRAEETAFLEAPLAGAYRLVTSLVTAIEPLTGTYAAVIAIVLCTLAVRLLLLPLSVRAHRGLKARAELMPQLREIT